MSSDDGNARVNFTRTIFRKDRAKLVLKIINVNIYRHSGFSLARLDLSFRTWPQFTETWYCHSQDVGDATGGSRHRVVM